MKILILGAAGMLGHMLFADLARAGLEVWGAVRQAPATFHAWRPDWQDRIRQGVDALDMAGVAACLDEVRPDVAVNAIGLIRQRPEGQDEKMCEAVNAAFPHALYAACRARGIRLVHYSTDCVFDGHLGRPYTEADAPSAKDAYGQSKARGEVAGPGALTLRTSIIGPELSGARSLLGWFLASEGSVRGWTRAIYTGLPTSEQARILREIILPRPDLEGLYQLAGEAISKDALLRLIAAVYEKRITITPDVRVAEDKRLDSTKFRRATGYTPPAWPALLAAMRAAHEKNNHDFGRKNERRLSG